jgi:hypothetical protein
MKLENIYKGIDTSVRYLELLRTEG